MKMRLYIAVLLPALFIMAGSCKKVFDVDRAKGVITPGLEWSTPNFVQGYVNNFYKILPDWNRSEELSAEAYSGGNGGNSLNSFLTGKYNSQSNYPDRVWDWGNVRSLNDFFANIKSAQAAMSSQDYQNVLGQAYFFRAYLYYRMVKVLGGVPIITTVQDPTADSTTLMVKRNSTLECFNFISLQLDSAIRLLPTTWGGSDIGRVTKGAAMAVKGEMLLLKASPLFCTTPNAGYW